MMRWHWSSWAALAAGIVGLAVAAIYGPKARAAENSWKLWVCEPAKECELRGKALSGPTACQVDLASATYALPSGTRLACVQIKREREAQQ
jgi:hypothetical protein